MDCLVLAINRELAFSSLFYAQYATDSSQLAIYDLQGRSVAKVDTGIYIKGGKKVMRR